MKREVFQGVSYPGGGVFTTYLEGPDDFQGGP